MTIRRILATLGLLVAILPVVAFWLSWGVTRASGDVGFGFGTYSFEIQHTGKDAGPFGYTTLTIGALCIVLWAVSIVVAKSRGFLIGQISLSVLGAGIVLFGLLSHPDIGWPLGPNLAISGFTVSAIIAGISILVGPRKTA